MSVRKRRSVVLLVSLLVLSLSAGCLMGGSNAELPDRASVEESLRSIDAIEADVTVRMETDNGTSRMRMSALRRYETGEARVVTHDGSSGERMVTVSNRTTTWLYTASSNSAIRMDVGSVGTGWNRSVESIGRMFASLANSSSGRDVSISPLPVVPSGGRTAVGTVGVTSMPSMGNVTLTYAGTENAVDRETYVVDITPATKESLLRNGTLWFDTERYYPVKSEYTMSMGGERTTVAMRYSNISYDPTIPDGTFDFDPPANATVRNVSQSSETHQTRTELERETTMSVPEPDVPDGFTFDGASSITTGGNASFSMEYTNGTDSLSIRKATAATGADNSTTGEAVEVAGHEGTFTSFGETSLLSWECDGRRYSVAGSLSEDRLVTIAESMACE